MVGRINDENHCALLNTKYRSLGTHDFREDCKFLSIVSLYLDDRCMVGKVYVGNY